ncbi:LGFP repeat-containing protein [Kineococcus sp. SYSU DK018]|uniref:LGFP repeat-containing protein n=1 Tax=Kineococcus sp. SYSU DK018 TaxID=3383139 RepID=UPI003D7E3949
MGGEIGYAYEYRYNGPRGFLGEPLTGEIRTPNGKGAYVAFQGGSIYWSPWTGAHEVHGQILDGWGRLGWEGGFLGFPTGNEEYTDSRRGRYQEFEGGSVLWAPWTGAHALRGDIRFTYLNNMADPEGALGFPTTSEIRTPNGRGAYNAFQWGSIYWTPDYGAYPIWGQIRDIWARQGWENGRLGFPISGPLNIDGTYDQIQIFEGGFINWWPGGYSINYD